MPGNRNIMFLIIGALIVAVGVLGYNLYQTKKEPEGLQINVGPNGSRSRTSETGRSADHEGSRHIKRFSLLLGGVCCARTAGHGRSGVARAGHRQFAAGSAHQGR